MTKSLDDKITVTRGEMLALMNSLIDVIDTLIARYGDRARAELSTVRAKLARLRDEHTP